MGYEAGQDEAVELLTSAKTNALEKWNWAWDRGGLLQTLRRQDNFSCLQMRKQTQAQRGLSNLPKLEMDKGRVFIQM